jgi:hypothetical protein
MIFRISRQTGAGQHGNVVSREMATPFQEALPLPDCFVTESSKGIYGKGTLLCLELLEAHHPRTYAIGSIVPALAQNARMGRPLC